MVKRLLGSVRLHRQCMLAVAMTYEFTASSHRTSACVCGITVQLHEDISHAITQVSLFV